MVGLQALLIAGIGASQQQDHAVQPLFLSSANLSTEAFAKAVRANGAHRALDRRSITRVTQRAAVSDFSSNTATAHLAAQESFATKSRSTPIHCLIVVELSSEPSPKRHLHVPGLFCMYLFCKA